ncbi:choline/ethanolamine kinase family protein [Paenibacillus sp. PL91]|uniref:choline/ethanolamine kinase family protein n=1 Tax=Paenibacillus sp. PL91 TaxID=2729538 RepID=UPI00145E0E9D|nr:choline/ethanolamine kinase family protein [Paenibacillus sp. PL91]MBC9201085.1 phosphotransferase family protein [Paenibacillus sp. PL91]
MNKKVEGIIRGVPELNYEFLSFESLNGGLCNQTYKVQTKQSKYVLRINSRQNEYLNLTRSSEVEVMKKANREGFAPKVISSNYPEQFVVTEFIEGRMLEKDDLKDGRIKEMIMDRLKRVHRMEGQERTSTPYNLIYGYLKGADQFQVKHPEGLSRILHRVEKIAHMRSNDKEYNNKFCHNDSFLCNMIYTGQQLQIIDWELSGVGDVFFELTLIPFTNQFSETDEREWLKLYFGYYEEETFRIFQDMKFVSMVREVAWGMFYSGLTKAESHHDFDYYKFSEYCIQRIEQGIYQL